MELYKLHIKHYHMSPTQFRRRTSMLGLPDSVYEKYEEMYNKCRVCSTSIAPPPRARISGIRSTNFGDVIFVDHAEIQLRKNKYMALLVLDGATNLLWATAQNSLNNKETIQALRLWTDEHNCMPKAIVGDEAFFQEDFLTYTELMVSRNVPVVQEPHGLTELNQLSDFSNDNGKLCPRTLKMIGSEELPLEKL